LDEVGTLAMVYREYSKLATPHRFVSRFSGQF
jgi:hypothetical protein